jgi:Fungal Zn(2)-Cys(6) binuclear cluster domain/Fungal specific transcription factor domain
MPPRLSHKKSRTGCRRCKLRRVKCDETRPTCANCHRHGVLCEYAPLPAPHSASTYGVEPYLSPSNGSIQSGLGNADFDDTEQDDDLLKESEQRRLLEMQLLHHFISVIVPTLPSSCNECISNIWTKDAISLAFHHPFLLNTILALSALHLSRESLGPHKNFSSEPEPPAPSIISMDEPAKLHRTYSYLAVRQQRAAVASVSADNANALFLSTILLSYQAMDISRGGGLDAEAEADTYGPPTQWLRMTYGIRQTSGVTRPLVMDSAIIETMVRHGGEPDFSNVAALFDPDNRLPLRSLLDWEAQPEPEFDHETKRTYEDAVAYVGSIYRGIQRGESSRTLFRRLLCLGTMVPEQFLLFVEQRRPRALVILAYYSSMAIMLDDHWVFKGMAKRELTGLQESIPAEWQWALDWPLTMLVSGPAACLMPS